jgi:hypothetical protein
MPLPKGWRFGPYTGGITETITADTISTQGAPDCNQSSFCIISSKTTTITQAGLGGIGFDFSVPEMCYDCTAPIKVVITFDEPILGIAGESTGLTAHGGLNTNLDGLPEVYSGFLGVTEQFNTLSFSVPCCTDSSEAVYLNDLVVATVPEPPTWTLLILVGLFGALVLSWRRSSIQHSYR